MAETKAAMSLGIATVMLLFSSACSEGPVAPAPVYLMGRTTAGPAQPIITASQPVITPAHPQVIARAPAAMMQPRSPAQHHATPPAVVEKTHSNRLASRPAHRRTHHAAHVSRVAATESRPNQIPLDEPASPSSQEPTTKTWVSPPPAETR
jgi:hypothetical protein